MHLWVCAVCSVDVTCRGTNKGWIPRQAHPLSEDSKDWKEKIEMVWDVGYSRQNSSALEIAQKKKQVASLGY